MYRVQYLPPSGGCDPKTDMYEEVKGAAGVCVRERAHAPILPYMHIVLILFA